MIEEKIEMPLNELVRNTTVEFGNFHIKLSPNSAIADKNVNRHVYINIYDMSQPIPSSAPFVKEHSGTSTQSGITDKGKFTNRECEIIELMLQLF